MNKAFVGRELKMVELKKQIKELEELLVQSRGATVPGKSL
jgi:hypothetical protein